MLKTHSSIFLILFVVLFTACEKSSTAPTGTTNDMVDTSTAMLAYDGMFANGPYGVVKGNVSIYQHNNKYSVGLQNFSTSNGPDLHLYLSKEMQPIHFIDLGKIRSTKGNQLYAIPGTPDLTGYKYILIHCQLYNHLFGWAALTR